MIYARDVTNSKFSQFLDTNEIYEEWTLRWVLPQCNVDSSIGLFGIKIKKYWEEPGFWKITPELGSQAELKGKYELATSGVSMSTYKASVENATRSLPEDARMLIDYLIEDRENASSNARFKREWHVAALQAKPKPSCGFNRSWVKSSKHTDWLVMIKGETIDHISRKRPDRWGDPWRKTKSRRSNSVRFKAG
jgi:hypothetical protein